MKLDKKWLLAAPALGALLVLGPLAQSRGTSTPTTGTAAAKAADPETPPAAADKVGSQAVVLPEAWKVLSTLAGILILGGVGLVLLSRLRRDSGPASSAMVSLRQSLRLGAKARLHAVQFEGHLLLLGETEAGVTLLREVDDPQAKADEVEVIAREEVADGGAEPRDMGLLHAARQMAARQQASRQLSSESAAAAATPGPAARSKPAPANRTAVAQSKPAQAKPAQAGPRQASPQRHPTNPLLGADPETLNDFRALLRRAKAEKAS